MTIESEFLELMVDTATLYVPTGTDNYGKRSYSATGTVVQGRYQNYTSARVSGSGRVQTEVGHFYCYGIVTGLTTEWKMVPADGRPLKIVAVSDVSDENGPHHTTITFAPVSGAIGQR